MRTIVLVTCIALFASGTRAQPPKETYTSADGKYSIKFPGTPKLVTQTTKSALGDLQVTTATYVTLEGNVYMVSYSDFPPAAVKAEKRKSLFDGIKDGIQGRTGTLVSEKEAEFGPDKLPECQLTVDKGKQRTKFRAILRDNRLYQVAVIGTVESVTTKDATAFLESLELTK